MKNLEEARKLLKSFRDFQRLHQITCKTRIQNDEDEMEEWVINSLLEAQDLVSREEERQRCAEIFRRETEGVCHAACNKPLYLSVIYEKILNHKQNE